MYIYIYIYIHICICIVFDKLISTLTWYPGAARLGRPPGGGDSPNLNSQDFDSRVSNPISEYI